MSLELQFNSLYYLSIFCFLLMVCILRIIHLHYLIHIYFHSLLMHGHMLHLFFIYFWVEYVCGKTLLDLCLMLTSLCHGLLNVCFVQIL